MPTTPTRSLSSDDARLLRPGDDHYMAYVGPPAQYDFMGATQFRLLTALGLRASHRVLDVGCGSLRAGRLLIPYLDRGRYFGIEPNMWLVEEAIERELGRDLIRIKQPRFDANDSFQADAFGERFDFIVAQSIFSHTAGELATTALASLRQALAPGGLIACTFVESPASERHEHAARWTYPGCVRFTREEVATFFTAAGLHGQRLDWFHPRQTWYLGAASVADLPSEAERRHLAGVVLRSAEFAASLRQDPP
jgi:SAM-dependent methyltransferase